MLTSHHGDLEAAYNELGKTQIKPFLMRIWGPPTGIENEAGNDGATLQKFRGEGTFHCFLLKHIIFCNLFIRCS